MSSIINVFELSKHHLKKDGKFVFYKAKKTKDEIMEFKKKYPSKEFKIIPYTIPFKEVLDRNLVVL